MARRLFLTPPSLPDETAKRLVELPDSADWWGMFNAAFLLLIDPTNYEQVDGTDLTPEATAATFYAAYVAYLEGFMNCCAEDAAFKLPDIGTVAVNGGVPQWSPDGGTTWVDLPEKTGVRVPDLTPTEGGSDDAKICNAAERAVITINELYKATFSAWGASLLTTTADIVKFLANLAPVIIQEDVYPYGALVNVDTHTDDWQAEDLFGEVGDLSEDAKDALRCLLYNNATVSAGGIVRFDWEAVTDNVINDLGVNPGTAVFLLLSYIAPDGLNRAGNVGDATGTCDTCLSWCYEWDFTLAEGDGWHGESGAYYACTTWISGTGWRSGKANCGDNSQVLTLIAPMLTGHVTHIDIYYHTAGVGSGGVFAGHLYNGATDITIPLTGTAGDHVTSQDVDIEPTVFYMNLDNFPDIGYHYVSKIRMSGPGANPFGEDNC